MASALVIFLSGGAGCLSRYLINLCVTPIMGLPLATFIVNVSGGFFAGVVVSKFSHLKPILLIGFLGGFTTFSAFSLINIFCSQFGDDSKPTNSHGFCLHNSKRFFKYFRCLSW